MTREQILNCVDTLRPNLITESTKLHWIDVLEKQILSHMTQFGETDAKMSEETVLAGEEYLDMYVYYVISMIDLANQDIAMYNNSSSFFNEMFSSWQKKWRREHMPRKSTEVI